MAAKKKKIVKAPKEPKAKKERAPRKETRENPGPGHNLSSLRKAIVPFAERFFTLSDSMLSDMAGYRSDFKELYDEAAGDTGLKKSVVTKELKRLLANKKAIEAEKDLAPDEREQIELLRAAFEGTPFSEYAAGLLADAPDSPQGDGDPIDDDPQGDE